MILSGNGYSHPDNECLVTFFGAQRIYNPRGQAAILRRTMRVEGEIIAATTAAIDARVAEIRAAYAVEGGSVVLYTSAGAATQFQLPSAGSINGVRIVEGPTFFTQDAKAHYATGLPFAITFEADYLQPQTSGVQFYSETIVQIGDGGARRIVIEVDNGSPVEQVVSTHTPVVIIQSGEAMGYLSYITPNTPLYSQYLDQPDGYQLIKESPQLLGGSIALNYVSRWNYRMTIPTSVTIPFPSTR